MTFLQVLTTNIFSVVCLYVAIQLSKLLQVLAFACAFLAQLLHIIPIDFSVIGSARLCHELPFWVRQQKIRLQARPNHWQQLDSVRARPFDKTPPWPRL